MSVNAHPSSAFGTFSPRGGEKANLFALLAFLLITISAEAKLTIPIGDYITRLEQLHGAIAGNQLETAKAVAAELAGSEIVSPRGNFHADDLGKWVLGTVGLFDAPHWQMLFTGGNRRYLLILLAGAVESGDDLRGWFEELRRIA